MEEIWKPIPIEGLREKYVAKASVFRIEQLIHNAKGFLFFPFCQSYGTIKSSYFE